MQLIIRRNKERLEHLERIIEMGLQSFYEVGKALLEIRDNQLYEKVRGIANFETYCKERWGFNASRARQLIASVGVIDNVKSVTTVTPNSERQTRPLVSLSPEKQVEVWQEAIETAPEGKITAAHVQAVIDNKDDKQEESDALFNLKRWWKKATKKDKKDFLNWIKE